MYKLHQRSPGGDGRKNVIFLQEASAREVMLKVLKESTEGPDSLLDDDVYSLVNEAYSQADLSSDLSKFLSAFAKEIDFQLSKFVDIAALAKTLAYKYSRSNLSALLDTWREASGCLTTLDNAGMHEKVPEADLVEASPGTYKVQSESYIEFAKENGADADQIKELEELSAQQLKEIDEGYEKFKRARGGKRA